MDSLSDHASECMGTDELLEGRLWFRFLKLQKQAEVKVRTAVSLFFSFSNLLTKMYTF